MKQKTIILFAAVLAFSSISVQAQSPTTTLTPVVTVTTTKTTTTPTPVDDTLQHLKEKVASKISEKMKNSKAVSGVVTKMGDKSVIIKTDDAETIEIKLDDALTNYYQISGVSTKEIKKDVIEEGTYVIATGPQFDNSINANVIYVDEKYMVRSGKISAVNKTDFSLEVVTNDKETITLDVQTGTTQQIINIKTLAAEKIGFSKYKEGDTIHFIVKRTKPLEDETRFDGVKILVIPQEFFLK